MVQDYKYDLTRHKFYDGAADKKGDVPYDWGVALLSIGSVKVVDGHYSGRLVALPDADGYLLDVDEYE